VSKGPAERNVALLFERVEGREVPLLDQRVRRAPSGWRGRSAWSELDELATRVAGLLDLQMPGHVHPEASEELGTLFDVAKAAPRRSRRRHARKSSRPSGPSLAGLPALQCWPGDGGRYITLPGVFTRDPVTGARNVGMYRLQYFDERTLGHALADPQGRRRAPSPRRRKSKSGQRMDVAIALGGDPAMVYAASAPLPPGVDEVVFAGWLRGAPVELVKCRTVDLEVPAEAEIILEGYVDPTERRLEGPFGDHTGYYSLARDYPVFHLTAGHAARAGDLPDDHRRTAAAGRLLARQGDRAALPADHEADAAGDRGREHAGRGRVPQPRDRLHQEALTLARRARS
jgi:4-hydroxy-3-polyprenylbenzoate decarboxylase